MPTVDDAEGASMVSSLLAFPVCHPREPAVQLLAVHLTVHTNGSSRRRSQSENVGWENRLILYWFIRRHPVLLVEGGTVP